MKGPVKVRVFIQIFIHPIQGCPRFNSLVLSRDHSTFMGICQGKFFLVKLKSFKNIPLITQVIVCFIGGISADKFAKYQTELPFMARLSQTERSPTFLSCNPKSPGDKDRLYPAFSTLMRCPMGKSQKKQWHQLQQAKLVWKKMKDEEDDAKDWDWYKESQQYLLTDEDLKV
jgi:hypothetical protein